MDTAAETDREHAGESRQSRKREAPSSTPSSPPNPTGTSHQRSPSPLANGPARGSSILVCVLRFDLDSGTVNEVVLPAGPEDLCHGLKKKVARRYPLCLVHGLPANFLDVIRDCAEVDLTFFKAHASRKNYRPDKTRDNFTWAHWEYPELATRYPEAMGLQTSPSKICSKPPDLMGPPVVKPVDHEGLSAIFRRVSLWSKLDGNTVVFLDIPHGKDDGSPCPETGNQTEVTEGLRSSDPKRSGPEDWVTQFPRGEETPDLETDLYAALKHGRGGMQHDVGDVVSKLVYDRWLELFRALPPPESICHGSDRMGLLWEMLQSLEKNLQTAADLGLNGSEWNRLLRRIQRVMDNLACTLPANQMASTKESISSKRNLEDSPDQSGPGGRLEGPFNQSDPLDWEQINRRSLDRITYLGGIMLPVSVVSGILGIEGRYGSEGYQFWVFWVAAFVSSSICLLIIYLDQLRGLNIWFEVPANDAGEAMFPSYQAELGMGSGRMSDNPGGPSIGNPGTSRRGRQSLRMEGLKRSGGKIWRREELGWGGAVKKTVGYYRFKGDRVRFDRPEADEDG
ncbi:uncharacterized protein DNG_08418 [Cephalotrichum gorgonifer]|uniref:Uncharacterized protein n=1 Tax=Cephalotrichum gorgonifer TaxID=2041049 RepID=A0AAE8SYB9_9PEZI|nr:uncharacterized protein DNG_08418 [Cephalotrichum gorgonifer]